MIKPKYTLEELRISEAKRRNRYYYSQKLKAFSIVGRGHVKCVCGCGCTDIRLLEINHKNGGGRKEMRLGMGFWLYREINAGRRTIDDLELTCKPFNAVHALMLKFGLKNPPFTVIWDNTSMPPVIDEVRVIEKPLQGRVLEIVRALNS